MTSERLIPFGSNPMLARILAPDHVRPDVQGTSVLKPALATPRLPKIDMGVAAA
jgi:hypothetical protein